MHIFCKETKYISTLRLTEGYVQISPLLVIACSCSSNIFTILLNGRGINLFWKLLIANLVVGVTGYGGGDVRFVWKSMGTWSVARFLLILCEDSFYIEYRHFKQNTFIVWRLIGCSMNKTLKNTEKHLQHYSVENVIICKR